MCVQTKRRKLCSSDSTSAVKVITRCLAAVNVSHNQPTRCYRWNVTFPLFYLNNFISHQGPNKKFDFLLEDNADQFFPSTDAEDFNPVTRPTRQDSREEFRGAQARDPLVGTEVYTLSSR